MKTIVMFLLAVIVLPTYIVFTKYGHIEFCELYASCTSMGIVLFGLIYTLMNENKEYK